LESFKQKKERAIKNLQEFLSRAKFAEEKVYKIPNSFTPCSKTEWTYEEILKEMEEETPDGLNFIEIWSMDIEREIKNARKSICGSG